jgi:hypothetical protein
MKTAGELQALAWRVLVKELGLVDALRYRILFEPGFGDYTQERGELFRGITLDQWLDELRRPSPES